MNHDISTKVATRVTREINNKGEMRISRLAAIISVELDPLVKLLKSTLRDHKKVCPAFHDEDGMCDCGANQWNSQVNDALNGKK
jgi:hypothetical protein